MKITELEKRVLKAVIFNEYQEQNGSKDTKASETVGCHVWVQSVIYDCERNKGYTPGVSGKGIGAVIGSLSKKRLVNYQEQEKNEYTVALTEEGAEVYEAAEAIERGDSNLSAMKKDKLQEELNELWKDYNEVSDWDAMKDVATKIDEKIAELEELGKEETTAKAMVRPFVDRKQEEHNAVVKIVTNAFEASKYCEECGCEYIEVPHAVNCQIGKDTIGK
jgi:predicted transcriptional regulator